MGVLGRGRDGFGIFSGWLSRHWDVLDEWFEGLTSILEGEGEIDATFPVGDRAGFMVFFRVAKVVLTLRVR